MKRVSKLIFILICTFVEVHCVDLEYKTFRCPNGTYISNQLICDGEIDCVGSSTFTGTSDESSCDKENCGVGEFNCGKSFSNGYGGRMSFIDCKNATVRCNTLHDCSKIGDEYNCGDEVNVKDCSLGKGKYLCDDGLRCLDFNLTCDGFCNCFDCSDEKSGCLNDGYSNDNTLKASQIACFKTPDGPLCCSEFDALCQECDSKNDICDHKCVQFVNNTGCFCDENYVGGVGDIRNSKCWPKDNTVKGVTLLYWTDRKFRSTNLFTHTDSVSKELTYECTASTAAHDYAYYSTDKNLRIDRSNNYFYEGSSRQKKRIFKMSAISNDEPQEIINSDEKIVSLAVDWITNNIYYSTSSSLSVCSNDGKICKQLKSGDITFVTLAPRFGLMFWVAPKWDSGSFKSYLTKSSMDGSDENHFDDLIMESCTMMVADELTERLYFYKSGFELRSYVSEIRSVTFKGDHMKVWTFDSHMHFITVFENNVFFISNDLSRISSMNLKTKIVSPRVSIDRNGYSRDLINKLHVYNPLLQRTKIPNPCPASCSGLCLLRPSSSKGFLNYTCLKESINLGFLCLL
ncbi:vitellogenin receptor-like [Planococcus citri]|uniref:vitellogenin receptor-like n=1 Tax=Planococcus citri TaxID=170843 RepID=UPI0031F9E263